MSKLLQLFFKWETLTLWFDIFVALLRIIVINIPYTGNNAESIMRKNHIKKERNPMVSFISCYCQLLKISNNEELTVYRCRCINPSGGAPKKKECWVSFAILAMGPWSEDNRQPIEVGNLKSSKMRHFSLDLVEGFAFRAHSKHDC